MVVQSGQVSISSLQRKLRIGFSRAARLVDMMEADGLVSAASGSKPREVLVDRGYFDEVDRAAPVIAMTHSRPCPRRCARRGRRVPGDVAGGRGAPRRRAIATRRRRGSRRRRGRASPRRRDSGPAAERQERHRRGACGRSIATRSFARRFPTSGYSDNALFQAADLASTLYAAYGRVPHRELVAKYVTWLVREYPSSSLRAEAQGEAAQRRGDAPGPPGPRQPRRRPPRRSQSPAAAPVRPARRTRRRSAAPESPAARRRCRRRHPVSPSSRRSTRTVLPDVVRLTLPLDREVTFTHEMLGNPPRAFIDLRGVTATPALLDTTLDGDDTVRQVRVGRRPDATRVVLDLEASAQGQRVRALQPLPRGDRHRARRRAPSVQVPVPAESPVLLADDSVVPAATATAVRAFRGRDHHHPPPVPLRRRRDAATRASAAPAPPPVVPARATAPTPVRAPAAAVADAGGTADDPETPLPAVPCRQHRRRLLAGPSARPGRSRASSSTPATAATIRARIANGAERGRDGARHRPAARAPAAKEPGLDVVLTRRTDVFVPLEQRTAIANREGADLFLSIHANASRNTSARGIETYFLSFASSPDAEAVAARENATSERAMHNLPGIVRAIALNNKLDESRDLATMVQEAMTTRLVRSQQRAAQPRRQEGAVRGADRRRDAERARRGGVPHQPARGGAGQDAGLSPADRRGTARRGHALPPVAQAAAVGGGGR